MSLKYVAAYLMSSLSGVESPEASHVESILGSVGATVEKDIVNKLISELQGKDIQEVLAAGMSKLQSIPSGGSAASSSPISQSAQPGNTNEAKEEKVEEPEEEEEDDMGFSLFD